MTDAEKIEFLQQRVRLLEQRLQDAKREIEDLNDASARRARDRENHWLHALEFGDYERPEVVFQAVEPIVRRWPRERRQALADRITLS
jgi:hypothetical protein